MSSGQKEFFEITPLNQPSNSVYSSQTGNKIVSFVIPSQDTFLQGGELRLCGKFKIKRRDAAGAAQDIDNTAAGEHGLINSRMGAYSFVDILTISSADTAQQIESIRNYGRFWASSSTALLSEHDYLGDQSNEADISTNLNYSAKLVDGGNGVEFSMRLYCGLLSGTGMTGIPLSRVFGLKGLRVDLHLTEDSTALTSFGDAGMTTGGGGFFELENLSLMGSVVRPPPEALGELRKQTTGRFEFNSINSQYFVMNSSDSTNTMLPNLRNIVGFFANFIPVTYLMNYSHDSYDTARPINSTAANGDYAGNLVQFNRVSFFREGMKFPLQYDILKNTGTSDVTHAQLVRNGLDAVRNWFRIDHTIANNEATNLASNISAGGAGGAGVKPSGETLRYGGGNFLIGCNFDGGFSDMGADFSKSSLSINLQTDLGANGFEAPTACFLYLNARQALGWSPQGIEIVE